MTKFKQANQQLIQGLVFFIAPAAGIIQRNIDDGKLKNLTRFIEPDEIKLKFEQLSKTLETSLSFEKLSCCT